MNIKHLCDVSVAMSFDFVVVIFPFKPNIFIIISSILLVQPTTNETPPVETIDCTDSIDGDCSSSANTSKASDGGGVGRNDGSVGIERNKSFRNLKIYAKQMLKNRIFLAHYQEKRYVNKLRTYKDLIVMNKNEKILCDDIAKVQSRINSFFADQTNATEELNWLGFTHPHTIGAPAAYCIWTTLDADGPDANATTIAFGEYWFQIRTIKFNDAQIEIQLKVLRPVNNLTSATFALPQNIDCDSASELIKYVHDSITTVDWLQLFASWRTAINEHTYRFVSEQVTLENMKHAVRIAGIVLLLTVTAFIQVVQYMGEFTLKFIHEFSRFLHVATPIILALIDTMGKIVGGLYILIAMSIRGGSPPNRMMNQRGGRITRKPPAIRM